VACSCSRACACACRVVVVACTSWPPFLPVLYCCACRQLGLGSFHRCGPVELIRRARRPRTATAELAPRRAARAERARGPSVSLLLCFPNRLARFGAGHDCARLCWGATANNDSRFRAGAAAWAWAGGPPHQDELAASCW